MMQSVQFNKTGVVVSVASLCVALIIVLLWKRSSLSPSFTPSLTSHTHDEKHFKYSVWPKFHAPPRDPTWFKENCFPKSELTIGRFADIVEEWGKAPQSQCKEVYAKLDQIYTIKQRSGKIVYPEKFQTKVKKWLGGKEDLFKQAFYQTVTSVFNEYTQENTLYNPLRGKRPMSQPDVPARQYVEKLYDDTKGSCDFCQYKDYSAHDVFGRMENTHAFSAANAFKVDAFHGLVLFKNHHPLNWTWPAFADLHSLIDQWYDKVHSTDRRMQYPCLFWDMLPHGGASQVHPHVHVTLAPDRYYGPGERFRRAGERYYRDTGRNYFNDFIDVHHALGLTVGHGDAHALAYLNGKKDTEVVIIARDYDEDFRRLFYCVLRAYIDDKDLVDFSLAAFLPSFASGNEGTMPAFLQVVTRGEVSVIRSDVSSLELFAVRNVNMDPWDLIKDIRMSVLKRGKE